MISKYGMKTTLLSLAVAGLCGCASTDRGTDHADTSKPSGSKARRQAVAVLAPAPNQNISGQVTFLEETQGIRVTANITGLTPGKHGFHIHEKGECTGDFTSAGGHFNPEQMPHGAPTATQKHIGDMGNIEADANGVARYNRVFQAMTFSGANSILGKAVIVHAKADDLQTQPTGDAGGRVACGVIQVTP